MVVNGRFLDRKALDQLLAEVEWTNKIHCNFRVKDEPASAFRTRDSV